MKKFEVEKEIKVWKKGQKINIGVRSVDGVKGWLWEKRGKKYAEGNE